MTQANYIDASGLHTQTLAQIKDELKAALQAIYGTDINTDSNSPDGQMIGIYAQAKYDMLDTVIQVHNGMSPERAEGRVLDQRVALNGLIRRAATYTRVPITVTTDRVLTLAGVDLSTSPFTVADNSGNEFQLETTVTTGIGANILTFRASEAGAVLTTLNSITTAVTVTLGVLSVNNPSANTQNGVDEETDVELRSRRRSATANASSGFLDGLTGALRSIDGVVDAIVYENITNATDSDGIPAHSIWAIVDGGTDAAIADIIYRKRNAGCGMFGAESVDVTQVNGTLFPVKFDRANPQDLFISMSVTSTDPNHVPDETFLEEGLAEALSYRIYEVADFTAITAIIKGLDPLAGVLDGGGVSKTASAYSPSPLYPDTIQDRWEVDVANIDINVV